MRKALSFACLFGVIVIFLSSCVAPNALRPFPYGKWENATIGLTIDVNRSNNRELAFSSIYIEDGEEIVVYAFFLLTHGDLWIIRDPYWPSRGGPSDTRSTLFGGSYRLRDNQLHFRLTPFWQEQTGIKDTIIFEKILEYSDINE